MKHATHRVYKLLRAAGWDDEQERGYQLQQKLKQEKLEDESSEEEGTSPRDAGQSRPRRGLLGYLGLGRTKRSAAVFPAGH